jgi:uncharacterized Zn-finger protein
VGNSFPAPSQPVSPLYEHDTDPRSVQSAYPSTYYTNSANFPSNPPTTSTHGYSAVSPPRPMGYIQAQSHRPSHHIPRPQSTVPHSAYSHSSSHSSSHSYSHSPSTPYTHSYSNSYSQSQTSPSHPVHPRPRSNSHYNRAPSPPITYTQPQYNEIPIPQTIGISSDHPSSPVRPFACDLCSLSFNRQHDLKRHRETHTGEKPFLCNGGCGKTFTRKDALKRHQVSNFGLSVTRVS